MVLVIFIFAINIVPMVYKNVYQCKLKLKVKKARRSRRKNKGNKVTPAVELVVDNFN